MTGFSRTTSRGEYKLEKASFYGYAHNKYKKNFGETTSDSKNFQNFFLDNLNCFPNFPDVDLISELSYENYERNACKANLVFLPYEAMYAESENYPLIFTYANNEMIFEKGQIRLIRKLAESADENHALVLSHNKNGVYCFVGIINKFEINKAFSDYYFISITGYSNWSARAKNFDLFDFKNGIFCDFNKSSKEFREQAEEVKKYFKACSFDIDSDLLQIILDIINAQNHGTTFVVFNNAKEAETEANRLCDARRGFKAKNPLNYNEFVKCIPQLTKVDGGIILDSELNCYAYGCIYDGHVDEPFKGSLANGSRFNSTALYTHCLNNAPKSDKKTNEENRPDNGLKPIVCVGVVFSDDGGVKIAKM